MRDKNWESYRFKDLFSKKILRCMKKRLDFRVFPRGWTIDCDNNYEVTANNEPERIMFHLVHDKNGNFYSIKSTKTTTAISIPEDYLKYDYDDLADRIETELGIKFKNERSERS